MSERPVTHAVVVDLGIGKHGAAYYFFNPNTNNTSNNNNMLQLINPSSPVVPAISPSSSIDGSESSLKKPLRPLTAYHIFFQIEREYIIQTHSTTSSVGDTDPNKSVICDVPCRYRNIKLLPDWYAGPGKRQKRKHRKSHGMIGFLELSRVISQRWANLETEDMETRQYVTKIAKRELEEYKAEMKEYKLLTGTVGSVSAHGPAMVVSPPKPKKITVVKKVKKQTKHTLSSPTSTAIAANPRLAMVSPSSSPRPYDDDDDDNDYTNTFIGFCGMCNDVDTQQEEIDYSICTVTNNGNYVPCLSTMTGPVIDSAAAFDPLFELDNYFFNSNMTRRSVSEGGDDDFLQLLAEI